MYMYVYVIRIGLHVGMYSNLIQSSYQVFSEF